MISALQAVMYEHYRSRQIPAIELKFQMETQSGHHQPLRAGLHLDYRKREGQS